MIYWYLKLISAGAKLKVEAPKPHMACSHIHTHESGLMKMRINIRQIKTKTRGIDTQNNGLWR